MLPCSDMDKTFVASPTDLTSVQRAAVDAFSVNTT